MIRSERLTAQLDGDFVVFLIGMRINQPLRVDKWLPVAQAMPRMLKARQVGAASLGRQAFGGRATARTP